MSYVIEKGIPMPSRGNPDSLGNVLARMAAGDSVSFPKSIYNQIHPRARNLGFKVAIRSISDNEIRVWRTA